MFFTTLIISLSNSCKHPLSVVNQVWATNKNLSKSSGTTYSNTEISRSSKLVSDIPIKNLRRLLRIENEAGVVPPQHSYNTQTQAGGVAAHQAGRLQQQLGFHQTQLIQKLQNTRSQWIFIQTINEGM